MINAIMGISTYTEKEKNTSKYPVEYEKGIECLQNLKKLNQELAQTLKNGVHVDYFESLSTASLLVTSKDGSYAEYFLYKI